MKYVPCMFRSWERNSPTCSAVLLAGDLILNIDNPATDAIPIGTRIALAFLSAAAVRSAGFQGFPVAQATPAVQCVAAYLAMFANVDHRVSEYCM